MILEHETIERKAHHFTHWYSTTEMRLDQLNEMANFAAHFNPQWKVGNMITNATNLFTLLEQHQVRYLVMGGFAAVIYGVPRLNSLPNPCRHFRWIGAGRGIPA